MEEETAIKAEELRGFLCGENAMPEWDKAIRSSCFILPGKAVFLLIHDSAGIKLLGAARFAKDLPGNLPGERWRLAKSGATILTEPDHEAAGALRSFLQLPAPGCLKEENGKTVLLCRCGIAAGSKEAVQTLKQTGLTPCWLGGSAEEAFWSAFAAGWREPFFWCRSLVRTETGESRDPALTEKYAKKTFVLNDGSILNMPSAVNLRLPEAVRGCEAAETESAEELLVFARETAQAGGRLGLAVIANDDPAVEKACRSVAASYGSGRVAVPLARWCELRQNEVASTGCDLRNYPLAEAAEQIKNKVKMTV